MPTYTAKFTQCDTRAERPRRRNEPSAPSLRREQSIGKEERGKRNQNRHHDCRDVVAIRKPLAHARAEKSTGGLIYIISEKDPSKSPPCKHQGIRGTLPSNSLPERVSTWAISPSRSVGRFRLYTQGFIWYFINKKPFWVWDFEKILNRRNALGMRSHFMNSTILQAPFESIRKARGHSDQGGESWKSHDAISRQSSSR